MPSESAFKVLRAALREVRRDPLLTPRRVLYEQVGMVQRATLGINNGQHTVEDVAELVSDLCEAVLQYLKTERP